MLGTLGVFVMMDEDGCARTVNIVVASWNVSVFTNAGVQVVFWVRLAVNGMVVL